MLNRKSIQSIDIKFLSNPALEFINIIFSVSNLDELIKNTKKINFEIKEEILETLEDVKDELSRFMNSELNNFFNIKFDLGYKLIFKYIIDDTDIVSVKSLIKNIKKSNSDYVIETISVLYLKKTYDSIDDLMAAVEKSSLDSKTKEYIIDFIINSDEIHERLIKILNYFYKEVYEPMQDDILYILGMEKKRMEDDFYYEPAKFFDNYLTGINFIAKKPVRIHPSLFKQIWKDSLDTKYRFWVNLGIDSNKLNNANLKKKNTLQLYKILSDKTRLDMILLLSEKPYFVNELAEKLGISSPAVSHHISYLNKLNLVALQKDEHRYYYLLNKDRLDELLKSSNELLLGV